MSEIVNKENENLSSAINSLKKGQAKMDEIIKRYRPPLNGERYLTDKETSERLKISRRTLQEYRTIGKVPYILLGGKILYKENDLLRLLEENYCPVFSK
ncbi:helix-turn-helix domain-containing protein [Bacteroides graminisolvens]|uniref:helix-turn-helix domain-containing protein n=1 Tax=Bacteroides graminisolvens TaxID=477666 RepID=UPI0024093520|nr:helix-turn-helix domain-containing protein [Bacteroides graminisolvens]